MLWGQTDSFADMKEFRGMHMNRREMLITSGAAFLSASVSAAIAETSGAVATVTPGAHQMRWRSAPSLPRPVQEIYPAVHDGEIWLSGGLVTVAGQIIGPTAGTHIYDTASKGWRKGPALPAKLHHPHLQSHQGTLFCMGGFKVPSFKAIWVMQHDGWRLGDDGWQPLPPAPAPIEEAVTASIGDSLHICGGRQPKGEANRDTADHGDVAAHHVFVGGQWEKAAPLPTPRNSATAQLIGSHWHVVGGRTVTDGNHTAHEVYDAKEDRWRVAAPLPKGRSGLASGMIDGSIIAFGGESLIGERTVYGDVWIYDPASDVWRDGPKMLTPRHGLGGVSLDGEIYAIGGARQPSGKGTAKTVEVLSVTLPSGT